MPKDAADDMTLSERSAQATSSSPGRAMDVPPPRDLVDEPHGHDLTASASPRSEHGFSDGDSGSRRRRLTIGGLLAAVVVCAGAWGLFRIVTAEESGQSGLTMTGSAGPDLSSQGVAASGAAGRAMDDGAWRLGADRTGKDGGMQDRSTTLDPLAYTIRPDGYPAISRPNRTVPLAFIVPGLIKSVDVIENETVVPGQVLVRLEDDVQRRTVEAQRIIAGNRSDLEAALARHEMAAFDLNATNEAKSKDATSPRDEIRAEIEERLRANDIEAARRDLEQAQILLAREEARLDQMAIRSSIHGLVVEITAREGQAIDAYEPIMVVVSNDPLWLSVPVPMQLGLHVREGDAVVVRWRDLPAQAATRGRVLFVSPVSDASSNSILVRVEVANPDHELPSGLHAFVQFPDAVRRLDSGPDGAADSPRQLDALRPHDNLPSSPEDVAPTNPADARLARVDGP